MTGVERGLTPPRRPPLRAAWAHMPLWTLVEGESPVVAAALHAGHAWRPDLERCARIDGRTRRREEDPWSGWLARFTAPCLVVHRSRFEVDLNRPREAAVYRDADEAFGFEVWRGPLPATARARSLRLYDHFYAMLRPWLDDLCRRHRRFVVLDLHSYNHRRGGPGAAPADPTANPDVNLGTGALDRERWRPVVEEFLAHYGGLMLGGRRLSVGENVRFQGGHFASWINRMYAEHGCALAVEFKKFFMDEWTGSMEPDLLVGLRESLTSLAPRLLAALDRT